MVHEKRVKILLNITWHVMLNRVNYMRHFSDVVPWYITFITFLIQKWKESNFKKMIYHEQNYFTYLLQIPSQIVLQDQPLFSYVFKSLDNLFNNSKMKLSLRLARAFLVFMLWESLQFGDINCNRNRVSRYFQQNTYSR